MGTAQFSEFSRSYRTESISVVANVVQEQCAIMALKTIDFLSGKPTLSNIVKFPSIESSVEEIDIDTDIDNFDGGIAL
ncbi:hypothetical protein NIES4106_56400 (plasmid) [Fischerella sp. NIES-4106]|nr:hypothetical protein NIES4106_56400 [Fischerella sp. NIES-4106]